MNEAGSTGAVVRSSGAAEVASARSGFTAQQIIVFVNLLITSTGTVYAIWRAATYGVHPAELLIFFTFYFLTMVGITIGFHRLFSHASFKTSKWMRTLLAVLASMGSQGPLFTWVADHRRHHDLSDKEGDTHSPNLHGTHFIGRLRGFWHAHIGWMFTNQPASWARYIPDLMKDRQLFWVHRHYFLWVFLGLLLPTLAGWWLIGGWQGAFSGLLWGGLVRIFATSHVVLSIGSLGHMFGSQPFYKRTQDHSANNFWVSLLSFGECLQSNHHAFPASARHGIRWWEPDFNYLLIRLWRAIGLVWDVKLPPNATVIRDYKLGLARGDAEAT